MCGAVQFSAQCQQQLAVARVTLLSEGMGKQPGSQGSNQEELCVFSQS